MSMKELRERRNAAAKEARNFYDNNKSRKWEEADSKKYDELIAVVNDCDAQIERLQRLLDAEADETLQNAGVREQPSTGTPSEMQAREARAIYQKFLRQGEKAITAEEWTKVRNTMSTTTGSEGGYTVQTDVAKELMDALKQFGGMRAVAEVFQTAQGNPMSYPTSDGTSETGEIIGENATATDADMTFGTVALPVYKFSSKIVTVPFELLQDSSLNVEALVNGRLRTRLGRITNNKFTVGTGTNEPRGIVPAAGAGKVGTTGQTLTVIYDDLVDLEHSVDPAYRERGNCRFMMNDSSVKVVRKIKDTAGRPIWLPSYDAGIRGGAPQELLGRQIQVNQDMAAMAANAKSILFGDFSDYKIRDVMEITLFRFTDSAFAKKGQVGFLAWMRAGGNYTDVGGSVKYYQNSAT